MVILVEVNQIKDNWNYISETINRSFPEWQEDIKTSLIKDLLLGVAQAWMITNDDSITNECVRGMVVTRIEEDLVRGGKVLTVLAACAFTNADAEIFAEIFKVLRKFGKSKGCHVLDFYTDNKAIMNYIKMFNVLWQTNYFQVSLEE